MSGIVEAWLSKDALGKTGNRHSVSATEAGRGVAPGKLWEGRLRLVQGGKDRSAWTHGLRHITRFYKIMCPVRPVRPTRPDAPDAHFIVADESNHVDAMAQILKYGDNYRCMMKIKVEVELELDTAGPEPAREKKYPRFCGAKVKKYRNVAALSGQIGVSELKALLAGYLNLSEDVVDHCRIRVRKSLDVKVELMPWQEYQVETIQRIRCTVKEAWRKNRPRRNDAVWVKQLRGIGDDHYRALHGRKPAFVEAFFKLDCEYSGDIRKRNLALVNMLNPVDSGYVDPDEGLPWVEIPLSGPKYEIVDIDRIGGVAQLVPMNPAGGPMAEGDSRRWVVNSRIDLNSFGWIYYDEDQQHDDMARRRR